jgi:hypothetical protein
MRAARRVPRQCTQEREGFHASLICYHARLAKVKNVSADVSERQALSNLVRFSRSRDPIMKYDSLSTRMSPVDVGASLAGLEHCRDVPLFPVISGWERLENRLSRLLSCVGMSKLFEWLLLFFATTASSHAKDRRPAEDGGEARILSSIRLLRAMRGSNEITLSASANGRIGWRPFRHPFSPLVCVASLRKFSLGSVVFQC